MKQQNKKVYSTFSLLILSLFLALLGFSVPTEASSTVKLNKTKVTIGEKQTYSLKLKGATGKVTWSSSKKSVATVSKKGVVTGKKKGTATITAKSGGNTYKCKVTVSAPKISSAKATVVKKGKITLTMKYTTGKVTWSTSNKSVATVSSKGVVTGKKKGTATITAKVGSKKYTSKVTVEDPKISETTVYVAIGSSKKLKMKNTTKSVTWSSKDSKIASVSASGKVTGKVQGETVVTAKIDGVSYKCTVKVFTSISIEGQSSKYTDAENALAFVTYVNERRVAAGVKPLKYDQSSFVYKGVLSGDGVPSKTIKFCQWVNAYHSFDDTQYLNSMRTYNQNSILSSDKIENIIVIPGSATGNNFALEIFVYTLN